MSTPTTDFAYSYEYSVDINLGTHDTPQWQQIRFISAVNPQVSSVTKDGATYDDMGAPHPVKTGESWTLDFTVQARRQANGQFLPEVEALLEATRPDAVGELATREFRWYDDPRGGATPNPDEAYQGVGEVQMTRQNTGNDDLGGWSVTVTGQGRRQHIANPLSEDESSSSSSSSSGA